jgi:biotin operon repressor
MKRFEKVLLTSAPVRTKFGPLRPNIGLGYLAEMLLENGIEYSVLDMLLGYSHEALMKRIDKFRPDLVGISVFSNKYKTTYQIAAGIKLDFQRLAKQQYPTG